MYIRTLSLSNFRNYKKLEFQPCEGLNILVGQNAQGKSAILEAVYLLATSKSHRTSRDVDMIKLGEDIARAHADIARTVENDVTVELALGRREDKQVKINSVKQPRIGDLIGRLNAVIFSNEDINIVKGEPSHRRRFMNLEISQTTPRYVYALGRYKRVLEQRNNLLREIKLGIGQADSLEAWDAQLANYGSIVILRRAKFVDYLSKAASEVYSKLTDSAEEMTMTYKPSVEVSGNETEQELAERFALALSQKRQADFARGTSTIGPHRDDLQVSISGMAAREFASQGQQRTAAIALKLAEIDLMCETIGEAPVVLLDDVMAELDEVRRARVMELTVGRCQTLVTTTHLSELDQSAVRVGTVYEVKSGTVTRK